MLRTPALNVGKSSSLPTITELVEKLLRVELSVPDCPGASPMIKAPSASALAASIAKLAGN
jgi:hypothetical protein